MINIVYVGYCKVISGKYNAIFEMLGIYRGVHLEYEV